MVDRIMQCCYTNSNKQVGDSLTSGWQRVAVSEELPERAAAACVQLQQSHSRIQGPMTDEEGRTLNLLELSSDGEFLYFIRTRYGLLDRLGRPNMFSHGYIFSARERDFFEDPNRFLTLSDSNFTASEEEADKNKERVDFERLPPFLLTDALKESGVSRENYALLIKAVYLSVSDAQQSHPLYLVYEKEKEIRPLLFVIYSGLPFSLRRQLFIASCPTPNTNHHHLVFTKTKEGKDRYIVAKTGENSVLSEKALNRLRRIGFLDAGMEASDKGMYYKTLEKRALALGDGTAGDELVLKIAHHIGTETETEDLADEGVIGLLSDALRAGSSGSGMMEEYILDKLSEITRRRISLTRELEEVLSERQETMSESFREAVLDYEIQKLKKMSVQEAFLYLKGRRERSLAAYVGRLLLEDFGEPVLDLYFADALLMQKGDPQALLSVLREASRLRSRPKTEEALETVALSSFRAGLEENPPEGYRQYRLLLTTLFGADFFSSHKGRKALEELFSLYWSRVDYENFSFDKSEEYVFFEKEMQSVHPSAPLPIDIKGLFSLKEASDKGEEEFLLFLHSLCREKGLGYKDLKHGIGQLYEDRAMLIWSEIVAGLEDASLLPSLLKIRDGLREPFRQDSVLSRYAVLFAAASEKGKEEAVSRMNQKIVLPRFLEMERNQRPIPLDLWLYVGFLEYDNAFFVFDDFSPLALADESLAFYSKLLEKSPFREQAGEYIRGKGSHGKTIKKWMRGTDAGCGSSWPEWMGGFFKKK